VRRLIVALIAASVLSLSACRTGKQALDLSDQASKARLLSHLRARPDIDLKYVTVDVNAGVATLSGIVPNGEQLRSIRRIASGVRGVEQVLNNLVIQE
jgi:osmotically-inducible protein OsmY